MSLHDDTSPDIPPVPAKPQPASAPSVTFRLSRLTTTDRTVGVASLVAMISIWLPYYTATSGPYSVSFSGTFHTWLWLEFLAALTLLGYLTARALGLDSTVTLPLTHEKRLLTCTVVQLVLILIALVAIPYGDEGVGLGWAAFVGLIAALTAFGVLVAPSVIRYLNRNSVT